MPLSWSSDLEVGINELDGQQRELFSRFESFSEEIEKEHGHHVVTGFIEFLEKYSQVHFEYEERLQAKSNFPGLEEHLAAHHKFIEDIENFKTRMDNGVEKKELPFTLKAMMIRWIITHNKHMDKEFTRFLLAASEKAEQEFIRKKLGEILVESRLVSQATMEKALKKHQESGKKLGIILVEMGVASKEEIGQALMAQEGKSRFTKKLGYILVESGLVSYATLEHALANQKTSGKLLGEVFIDMGVITTGDLIEAQAIQKGMLKMEARDESR